MEEQTLTTSDGLSLKVYHWPVSQTREIIVLLHGLGGHGGKYGDVASFFNRHQISVIAPDLRGHGRSEGKRGHIPSYDQAMDDLQKIYDLSKNSYPDKDPVLIGHSFGGNLALNFAIRTDNKLSKLVLSSAWIRLAIDKRGIKAVLWEVYNKMAFWRKERIRPQASLVTQDEQMHKQYRKDPLIHSEVTTHMLYHARAAGRWALNNAHKLKLPVLIMHGTDDPITDHTFSIKLAENMGSNAALELWEGKLHELLHEKNKEEVWQYLLNWLSK